MNGVAVATSSAIAADAAYEVASSGGNAVDCALAAALCSMNTEPGVCALAGSAFITVWPAAGEPVTIDGNVAIPGRNSRVDAKDIDAPRVTMEYGGGVETLVGCGSVAVPGSLAALELAFDRYGSVPWRGLFEPTVRIVREGFPLPAACHYYLGHSGESVYGRSKDGYDALHCDAGQLCAAASKICVPYLADTLQAIADDGARIFYNGEIGQRIAAHCEQHGGLLSRDDLTSYKAIARKPLRATLGDWELATNPPPAVGGSMLAALLLSCRPLTGNSWHTDNLGTLLKSQQACLDYRRRHLDLSSELATDCETLLEAATSGQLLSRWASAATVHTSAVDSSGLACAITASSGYGAGEMPDKTGLWLNNSLGELELNQRGLSAGPIGARLPSNMTPSIARTEGAVLAVGSPGADRITTAMQQFLINYLSFDMSLEDAVLHPRLHVDTSGEVCRLMTEPGLELPHTDLPIQRFAEPVMYFGGIGAALFQEGKALQSAADPRREGATCLFAA